MVNELHFLYTAKSPILQTQPDLERKNMTSDQRRMAVGLRNSQTKTVEIKSIPVISGNSRRGISRHDFIDETLEFLGLKKDWQYSKDISGDTLMTLINGGTASAGKATAKPKIETFIETYNKLPFFGLFGGCFEKVFFEGRLSVGFGIPVTDQTKELINDSPFKDTVYVAPSDGNWWPGNTSKLWFVRQSVDGVTFSGNTEYLIQVLADHKEIVQILENMLNPDTDKEARLRKNLIKALADDPEALDKAFNALKIREKRSKGKAGAENQLEEKAEAVAGKIKAKESGLMPFGVSNYIPPGIDLYAKDFVTPGYGNDELITQTYHAFVETMLKRNYLGGMIARGFGIVDVKVLTKDGKEFKDVSQASKYWEWLETNKKEVVEILSDFSKFLFK